MRRYQHRSTKQTSLLQHNVENADEREHVQVDNDGKDTTNEGEDSRDKASEETTGNGEASTAAATEKLTIQSLARGRN